MEFLTKLFDTSDFPPRWHCGNWSPAHGWLHIISDFMVFGAYTALPCVLVYFILRRKDFTFPKVFWLFCAFIFACGTVHLIEASIFWIPIYRISGVVKLITAIVSWATVVALVRVAPIALALPTLASVNKKLEAETAALKATELQLLTTQAELRATLAQLQQSKDRTDAVVDSIGNGVIVSDAEGQIVLMNAEAKRLTGSSTLAGKPAEWSDAYNVFLEDGETLCPVEQLPLYRSIKGEIVEDRDLVLKNPRLEKDIHIKVKASPVLDSNGKPEGGVAVFHDVSRAKQKSIELMRQYRETEVELESVNRELERVLESVSDAIYRAVVDDGFSLLYVSENIEKISGKRSSELVNAEADWEELIHPADRERYRKMINNVISGVANFSVNEYRIRLVDESTRWIRDRITSHRGDDQVLQIHGVISDITDERSTKDALEEANRLASIGTLAAGLAHEINNPLGAMMLTSEFAVKKARNLEGSSSLILSLEKIQNQIERCSRIVNSVLTFAKQETSDKTPTELVDLARHARDHLAHEATKKRINVILNSDSEAASAEVNPTEIEQVFVNLISNAINASRPESTVEVTISKQPNAIEVSVVDHGEGMNDLTKQQAFDPFFTMRRDQGGTGLGLSISHGIVTEHGGSMKIQSEIDKGTTITFVLPVESGENQTRSSSINYSDEIE